MTPVLTASDYIQDGLIFQLDGIERGDEPGKWKELVSGIAYNVQNNVTGNNSVTLPPSINLNTMKGDKSSTVELCTIKLYHATGFRQVLVNGYTALSMQLVGSRAYIYQTSDNLDKNAYSLKNGVQCTAIKTDYVVQDGLKTPVNQYGYWSEAIEVLLGGVAAHTYSGKIHAMRVYNRQLTDDEILYNQRVDNIRFNLGLDLNGGIQPYTPGRELTMNRNLAQDEASPLESFEEPQTTEQEECVVVTER